jgi:hypothetical protein
MLEPSFALVQRLEQDQQRLAAERELKLQQQLEQLWQRIGILERHAQKSEADKTTLERLLREVVNENLTLLGRIQKLEVNEAYLRRHFNQTESDKAMLERRLQALETGHRPAEESSTTSPETEITSVRSTPNSEILDTNQEVARASAIFTTADLNTISLHPMLPSVLFMVDPESSKTSDGSDFPLKLLSSLRSIVKDIMADEMIDETKLARVQQMPGSIKGRCLHRYLQKSHASQNKCVWTKKHEQSYACRTCVNKQRVCMSLKDGQTLVLPLHPVL